MWVGRLLSIKIGFLLMLLWASYTLIIEASTLKRSSTNSHLAENCSSVVQGSSNLASLPMSRSVMVIVIGRGLGYLEFNSRLFAFHLLLGKVLLQLFSLYQWIILWRCPWCSRYRRRKWTRRHEFKSWTRLIAFHIALIPLGNVWIQLFSLQLWVNSRTD